VLWHEWPAVLPEPVGVALKLALVTGQRIGEVTGMMTDELDLFERRLWRIPAARSKNGHAHEVPLSTMALELVDHGSHGGYGRIFPAELSHLPQTVYRFRDRFSVKDWSPHDLRRTFASELASLGVAPHVIGYCLNHRTTTKAGVTMGIYVHYSYEAEKRQALELWADRLEAIVTGDASKIIPLRVVDAARN
jgi:integrase